jgi:hypothetical protein
MITLFTIAKPFRGHVKIIQHNAIRSWKASCNDAEIVVYGDDYGTRESCEELGVVHGGAIRRNEFGRFLVSDAFNSIRMRSRFELLGYVNCDIMLLDDFRRSLEAVTQLRLPSFLLSARRHLFQITESLSLSGEEDYHALRSAVLRNGSLDGYSALDCFVFPRSYNFDMPPFTVGQIAWDCWMIHRAIQDGVPVIDATHDSMLIHQNHDQFSGGPFSAEAKRNFSLAGGFRNQATLRDATWLLCEGDLRRPRGLRRTYLFIVKLRPVRKLLYFKRLSKRLLRGWIWMLARSQRT